MAGDAPLPQPSLLARAALRLTEFSERWIPDAFVFALVATGIVFGAGLVTTPATAGDLVQSWGKGFWELLPFTMQMAFMIVMGYLVSSSPPVGRLIDRLASLPRTGRGAVTMVALFAMLTAWLNWALSLIFSAMMARSVARRHPQVDYRALGASTFLGLGSVWAQGLSGSAALQMATPGALQPAIRDIVARGGGIPGGIIPLTHTVFLWQSLLSVVIEIAIVAIAVWMYCPPPSQVVTAQAMGIDLDTSPEAKPEDRPHTPGEWLEHSHLLTYGVAAMGVAYLVIYFVHAPIKTAAITVNTLNLAFLVLGMLLHGTPARLMRSVREAVPATWGILLQFPFYAGIAGMITYTHLGERIARLFVSVSSRATFSPIVALYSAVLGVFVPSGGSKWVIEAPYVMAAAHDMKVHLGWMVSVYDLGEAIANLVQPFFMVPTLAILGLRARDVMGYTFIIFLVLLPVVLVLTATLGLTLHYPL